MIRSDRGNRKVARGLRGNTFQYHNNFGKAKIVSSRVCRFHKHLKCRIEFDNPRGPGYVLFHIVDQMGI